VRRLSLIAVAAALVLAAAGCGSGSGSSSANAGQSHTVLSVSKAFSDAGIPFTSITTENPYISGQAVYLPGKLNGTAYPAGVLAMLSQTTGFTGVDAAVFDTDAHAATALKTVPLAKWGGEADPPVVRVHDGNVVVVAAGFKGDAAKKLQSALASLKNG
jgi:hypothetical protein